jgi:hypothetical protein
MKLAVQEQTTLVHVEVNLEKMRKFYSVVVSVCARKPRWFVCCLQ